MKKILSLLFIIININAIGQSFYLPYSSNNNFLMYASSCDVRNVKFKGVLNYLDINNGEYSIILMDNDVNTNQKQFKKLKVLSSDYYIPDFNSTIKQVNDSTCYILVNAYSNAANDYEGYILIKLINNQIVKSCFIRINQSVVYNQSYSDHRIIEHNNNLYILFSLFYGSYLIKLDKNTFNEIWSKRFYLNEDKTPGFDIKITSNEDIVGVMKDFNCLSIFKIDSNGNLIWSKSLGNNISYRHGKSIFIDNNYIYIAGAMNIVSPLGLFDYLFFSKFDLNNGSLLDSKVMQSNSDVFLGSVNFQMENNNIYFFSDIVNFDANYSEMYVRKGVGKFNFNNNVSNLIIYNLNDSNYTFTYPLFYSGGNKYCYSNSLYVFDNLEKNEVFPYKIPYFISIPNNLNFSCFKQDSTINFVLDTNLFNSEILNNSLSIQNISIFKDSVLFSSENVSFPTGDLCLLLSEKENDISKPEILVYPNPANDKVYISIPENNYLHLEIEIIDFSGKTIKKENTVLSNNYIDVNHLNNGVYFLRISLDNQILYSTKLLINR